MRKFLLGKLKIVIILIISIVVVRIFAPKVFIADSPQINPTIVAQLSNLPMRLAGLFRKTPGVYQGEVSANKVDMPSAAQAAPQKSIIYQIGQGVYAAEDKDTKKTYIMFKNDAKVKVYEYKLPSGKTITIYEPLQE
ncbi:hypothetical protein M1523_01995 [Patescibacteria group bacterium]|nr:hypothetical protein [Patescibacteria group bacterium]MCL5091983.1 hypothetical protein [Patescibacteria group bacterium]